MAPEKRKPHAYLSGVSAGYWDNTRSLNSFTERMGWHHVGRFH